MVGALAGAVLEVALTHVFSLRPTGEEDEMDAAMKIEENPSGYMGKVYNIGQPAFIIIQ